MPRHSQMLKWVLLILVTLLLLSTGAAYYKHQKDVTRLAEEQDIREAVFRYMFDHNESGIQKGAAMYCLSLGRDPVDPSDEFMKRFEGNKPTVRKVSECSGNGWGGGVVDKQTSKASLIFRVTTIEWNSNTEVVATGGYFEGNQSSSGNTYSVVKQRGNWTVTNDKMNWIS